MVKDTYNMISVDGDTSTNDTALLLANGLAGNPEITEENEDYETFVKALNQVNETLAKTMAGDGEGATALFEVQGRRCEIQRGGCDFKQIRHHLQSDQGSHLWP